MIVPKRITQQELEAHLWHAATLLRGVIDAGDYKQYIFPLLFYKRICNVHAEELAQAMADYGEGMDSAIFAEYHRFQLPAGERVVKQALRRMLFKYKHHQSSISSTAPMPISSNTTEFAHRTTNPRRGWLCEAVSRCLLQYDTGIIDHMRLPGKFEPILLDNAGAYPHALPLKDRQHVTK